MTEIKTNQKKILFSDYDGTLSPLNIKGNITAIKNFIDNNNTFVISTRRNSKSILHKINKYHIPVNFITCSNGSLTMDNTGKIVTAFEFNRKELTFLFHILKANKHISDIKFVSKNGNVYRDIIPNNAMAIRCNCSLFYNLKEFIKPLPGYSCYRYGAGYEIKPSYINKSFAANELIRMLKADKSFDYQSYSIGNTLNDYELLKNHNGYVVGYGSLLLKKKINGKTTKSVASLISKIS